MTLPTSNVSFALLNRELGSADTTANINLNNTCVRAIAGRPTNASTISMNDLRGKSITPLSQIGTSLFFTGEFWDQAVEASLVLNTDRNLSITSTGDGAIHSSTYVLCSQATSGFQALISSTASGDPGSFTTNSSSWSTISTNRFGTFRVEPLAPGESAVRVFNVTVSVRRTSNNTVVNSHTFTLTLATGSAIPPAASPPPPPPPPVDPPPPPPPPTPPPPEPEPPPPPPGDIQ